MTQPAEAEKLLVPAAEAAKMLSMGRSTFWGQVKAKKLPQPVHLGGLTRWKVDDLRRHVQAIAPTTPSTSAAQ